MPRHFHVPARELALNPAQPCPFLPALVLEGLAVTPNEQHHLILSMGQDRFYFGPTDQAVARRSRLLAAALCQGAAQLDPDHADLVGWWVMAAWGATLDELVDTLTGN